ncbi:MAG: hypothetical protein HC800_09845 [Phormidesmis sp. RL_2_1]|nr:hypothetical protein [Phormidesmis sp. RL_2_1]
MSQPFDGLARVCWLTDVVIDVVIDVVADVQIGFVENIWWVAGIIGLSAMVQSLAGFGFALVRSHLSPSF